MTRIVIDAPRQHHRGAALGARGQQLADVQAAMRIVSLDDIIRAVGDIAVRIGQCERVVELIAVCVDNDDFAHRQNAGGSSRERQL